LPLYLSLAGSGLRLFGSGLFNLLLHIFLPGKLGRTGGFALMVLSDPREGSSRTRMRGGGAEASAVSIIGSV
jgi:hypothetical protein